MARPLYALCSLLLLAVACNQRAGAGEIAQAETKADLLNEATGKHRLVEERGSVEKDDAPIPSADYVDGLEISTFKMKKKLFAHSDHHWVGAFKTNKRYKRLNLGVGMNYLFLKKSGDAAHQLVVVPEEAGMDPHYLIFNPYLDLTAGHPGPPLVITKLVRTGFVAGGCVECSTGHCSATDAGDLYPVR